MKATELNHGLKSRKPPWKSGERRSRSYGTNQVDGKKKGACKVCGESHAIWNCDVFKKRSIQEKWGYCKEARTVTGVWVMIILARSVPAVERVTSTVRDFILYIGWTAVGRIKKGKNRRNATIAEKQDDLNTTLKRFWDLETMGIMPSRPVMTPDESVAWRKVSESTKFENDHCVLAVPWWDDRPSLQNNRPLAEKRLKSTERKLVKDPAKAEVYQKGIEAYLEKKDIRRTNTHLHSLISRCTTWQVYDEDKDCLWCFRWISEKNLKQRSLAWTKTADRHVKYPR